MKQVKLLNNNLIMLIIDRLSDINIISGYKGEIYNLLNTAYSSIGCCKIYRNVKHMLKNGGRYKIVIDNNDNIYAVSTYRYFSDFNSYKCTLIAGSKNLDKNISKYAVQEIIKSDIINYKKLYWVEASGPIKHWHEKYGGIKIPSVYVPEILNTNPKNINIISEYTYSRNIIGLDEPFEKTMFGFSSESIMNKLLKDDKYINQANYIDKLYNGKVDDSIFEQYKNSTHYLNVLRTMRYIDDCYYEQNMFYNGTQETKDAIKRVLISAKEIMKTQNVHDEFELLYDSCVFIYKNFNVLKLHKLF